MWNSVTTRLILAAALLAVTALPACAADKRSSKNESGWQRLFKKQASEYHIGPRQEADTKFQLHPDPVLGWSQPVRGGEEGAVYLWLAGGRPAVIGTFFIYPIGDRGQGVTHEFQSLTSRPLVGQWKDRRRWTPPKDAVEWHPMQDAPAPADSAFPRLRQMRSLARRFEATSIDRQGATWRLRLLPRQLYRYTDNKAAGVLDGAMFGFVQGTDLEVVLLLEARKTGDSLQWHRAVARMSDLALRVHRGDRTVWQVEQASYNDSDGHYFCSRVEVRQSP